MLCGGRLCPEIVFTAAKISTRLRTEKIFIVFMTFCFKIYNWF